MTISHSQAPGTPGPQASTRLHLPKLRIGYIFYFPCNNVWYHMVTHVGYHLNLSHRTPRCDTRAAINNISIYRTLCKLLLHLTPTPTNNSWLYGPYNICLVSHFPFFFQYTISPQRLVHNNSSMPSSNTFHTPLAAFIDLMLFNNTYDESCSIGKLFLIVLRTIYTCRWSKFSQEISLADEVKKSLLYNSVQNGRGRSMIS